MATALFVIDIQNDLATDPETRVPHSERIRAAGEKILATARTILAAQDSKPATTSSIIVFVQHEEKPEDGPLVRDSEPWKLVFEPDRCAPRERLVHKWTGKLSDFDTAAFIPAPSLSPEFLTVSPLAGDAFKSNPNLAPELKASGIEQILAFGIQSECCVESTCNGALAAGFKVALLSGAHSTYDGGSTTAEEIERDVEERLRLKGVMVIPWEEAVGTWARDMRLSISDYWSFERSPAFA